MQLHDIDRNDECFFPEKNTDIESISINASETKEEELALVATNSLEENAIQSLKQEYQNEDIKAILSIENSDFYYPVVQSTDNDYYLTHNYQKEINALGAIYADYRINLENTNKILIYGHSSTKNQAPFNILQCH